MSRAGGDHTAVLAEAADDEPRVGPAPPQARALSGAGGNVGRPRSAAAVAVG